MAIVSFKGKNAFLSNFYPCPIFMEGVTYPSLENAYQAAKTDILSERVQFETCTAAQSKKLGRKVTMCDNWDTIKFSCMEALLTRKFGNGPLAEALKATAPSKLVEGNTWHDNTWGICSCPKCGSNGDNRLGKMLMARRDELIRRGVVMPVREIANTMFADALSGARSVGFVGSRACTEEQLKRLGIVAGYCAVMGKHGRSGGCEGADQRAANKYVEYGREDLFHIHMPWPQYNAKHIVPKGMSYDVFDDKYGKDPSAIIDLEIEREALWLATLANKTMTERYPSLFGRNALIVMGSDVLVYAINGDSTGTKHDISIARDLGITCINVSDDRVWDEVFAFLKWEKQVMDDMAQDEERMSAEEDELYDAEAEKDSQRQRQEDCGYPIV